MLRKPVLGAAAVAANATSFSFAGSFEGQQLGRQFLGLSWV
jgi:hypothetical protein